MMRQSTSSGGMRTNPDSRHASSRRDCQPRPVHAWRWALAGRTRPRRTPSPKRNRPRRRPAVIASGGNSHACRCRRALRAGRDRAGSKGRDRTAEAREEPLINCRSVISTRARRFKRDELKRCCRSCGSRASSGTGNSSRWSSTTGAASSAGERPATRRTPPSSRTAAPCGKRRARRPGHRPGACAVRSHRQRAGGNRRRGKGGIVPIDRQMRLSPAGQRAQTAPGRQKAVASPLPTTTTASSRSIAVRYGRRRTTGAASQKGSVACWRDSTSRRDFLAEYNARDEGLPDCGC